MIGKMQESLEVIAPNEAVTVGGSIAARVLAVSIKGRDVTYHVGYWNGNTWVEVVLPDSEVAAGQASKRRIGLRTSDR